MYQNNVPFKTPVPRNQQNVPIMPATTFRGMASPRPSFPPQNQVQPYQFLPRSPGFMPMGTARYNMNPMQQSFGSTSNMLYNNYFEVGANHLPPNSAVPKQTANSSNLLIPHTYNLTEQNKAKSVAKVDDKMQTEAAVKNDFKRDENEKVRVFTGNPEKVIKWHKTYKDYFCYYEVIAPIVSIQEGTMRLQKIMLLRDRKGPIIQITHYIRDHINIEDFFVGQTLRCIGRMVGPNIMHGLSIREARAAEITTVQRMCYISDHAISKALTKA